ncbi:VTT domain-containing protein [Nocardioides ginsengisoli]|uniref:DedA family protein n=1 Tax=Nocardioides ginsengisoli TaxID=363868 RepID=A0ABW3W3U7_9ACTN
MNSLVATPLVVPMLLGIKWLDPTWLQHEYGSTFIWIAIAIVFVECGLFFPFLPGDTLLFALGLFIAGSSKTGYSVIGINNEPIELLIAIVLLVAAAFAGNVAGYEIGRRLGPPLYERDGRILKKKYFDNTGAFFDKHGNKALVIGRFVPFVRTYITVVAGVTMMARRRFFLWSAVGALLWVTSITLLGYFLGAAIPALGENIDYVTLAILAFSAVPIGWEWWRHKRPGAKRPDGSDQPVDSGVE